MKKDYQSPRTDQIALAGRTALLQGSQTETGAALDSVEGDIMDFEWEEL
ncbi:MAG: hypothetical protein IJQ61_02990 [Bacteroidales bacterium]|nr:hypothetical protein [Bacteroidales bacterium]